MSETSVHTEVSADGANEVETTVATREAPPSDRLADGAATIEANLRRLDRRQWWLWLSACVVMILLTICVASFEFPTLLRVDSKTFVVHSRGFCPRADRAGFGVQHLHALPATADQSHPQANGAANPRAGESGIAGHGSLQARGAGSIDGAFQPAIGGAAVGRGDVAGDPSFAAFDAACCWI